MQRRVNLSHLLSRFGDAAVTLALVKYMRPEGLGRLPKWILAITLLLVPAIIWASLKAYENSQNDTSQWLPEDNPATRSYEEFREVFGADERVLVSWVGCTLDDPRLEKFAALVEERMEAEPETTPFQRIETGPRVIRELIAEPVELSREEAIERVQGLLVGPDGETTCAVIALAAVGDDERIAAVESLQQMAVQECNVPEDEVRLAGEAVVNVAIDVESQEAVDRWMFYSAVVAFAVAWLSLRNFKLALIVFVIANLCMAVCEATIYVTGGTMNLLVVIVPVLIYVLAMSTSVHLVNYYKDAVLTRGKAGAAWQAVRMGWIPCVISAVTTALGLGSLCVSHLIPVRQFGFYAATGVLVSLALILLWLTSTLDTFPIRVKEVPDSSRIVRFREGVVSRIIHYHWWLIGFVLLLMAFLSAGVPNIQTEAKPARFLSQSSRWWRDINWFEANLGDINKVEILLEFPKDDEDFLHRMNRVRDVEREVRTLEFVSTTKSVWTYSPALPPGSRTRGHLKKYLLERFLERQRGAFSSSGYLGSTEEKEIWRITASVTSVTSENFSRFMKRIRQQVETSFEEEQAPPFRLTGAVPMIFAAQEELLTALITSFALAFGLIAIVMMFVLRSFVAGFASMLPNVFPATVAFGIMGWSDTYVDVGSMMTASVALGIGVDDTIHFLVWFGRYRREGKPQQEAIKLAYEHCSAAILQTSLIVGLSLLVFYASSFRPVAQFGLLMCSLLAAALLGDLVLLPALLSTRLGAFFGSQPDQRADNQPATPALSASDETPRDLSA